MLCRVHLCQKIIIKLFGCRLNFEIVLDILYYKSNLYYKFQEMVVEITYNLDD